MGLFVEHIARFAVKVESTERVSECVYVCVDGSEYQQTGHLVTVSISFLL